MQIHQKIDLIPYTLTFGTIKAMKIKVKVGRCTLCESFVPLFLDECFTFINKILHLRSTLNTHISTPGAQIFTKFSGFAFGTQIDHFKLFRAYM